MSHRVGSLPKDTQFSRDYLHDNTTAIKLVQELTVHIINAATGEVLRDLTIDTTRDDQPQNHKKLPNP